MNQSSPTFAELQLALTHLDAPPLVKTKVNVLNNKSVILWTVEEEFNHALPSAAHVTQQILQNLNVLILTVAPQHQLTGTANASQQKHALNKLTVFKLHVLQMLKVVTQQKQLQDVQKMNNVLLHQPKKRTNVLQIKLAILELVLSGLNAQLLEHHVTQLY